MKTTHTDPQLIREHLQFLNFPYILEHHQSLAREAATRGWDHIEYLSRLLEGEAATRRDRSIARRIRLARFPTVKTLQDFNWNWPTKINRAEVQNLFRLHFLDERANVMFLGGVGTGKSHLSIALGYQACIQGRSVLFADATDIVNTLAAARAAGALKAQLRKYIRPELLVIDELGYLPIDKTGADLLFQVISQRYERGSIVLNSNKAYKQWPEMFHNDSTLTSAVLDRLLHHATTITITGRSYRMKDNQPKAD